MSPQLKARLELTRAKNSTPMRTYEIRIQSRLDRLLLEIDRYSTVLEEIAQFGLPVTAKRMSKNLEALCAEAEEIIAAEAQ